MNEQGASVLPGGVDTRLCLKRVAHSWSSRLRPALILRPRARGGPGQCGPWAKRLGRLCDLSNTWIKGSSHRMGGTNPGTEGECEQPGGLVAAINPSSYQGAASSKLCPRSSSS